MKRFLYIYIIGILVGMFHLSANAQTDGYNPSNPPNPDSERGKRKLTVTTSPSGVGTLSYQYGNYIPGEALHMEVWGYNHFELIAWIDDKGDTLSTNRYFTFTMPDRDVRLTAHLRYKPESPGNPESNIGKYHLTLQSKPKGACYFYMDEESEATAGQNFDFSFNEKDDFEFQYWEDEKGNIISTERYLPFTMPEKDVCIYAVFKYAPESPDNPGKNHWDSFAGQVLVDDFRPGNLMSAINEAIGNADASDVTHIIVSGKASTEDYRLLNYGYNFQNCAIFDLSRTAGVNVIPTGCFDFCEKVNHILLPASIEQIDTYAFQSCPSLSQLTIHALTPPSTEGNFVDFREDLVVYVPISSMQLYQNAPGWKDFTILPIQSDIFSVELNLPEECKDGRYKNMMMELVNIKNGQRYKYVITDRINYIFNNLLKGTLYNAYIKNLAGIELSRIDSISVEDKDLSMTFDNILALQDVRLKVLSPEGKDVSSKLNITWTDENESHLGHGSTLNGMVEGQKVKYAVTLPQELGMQCVLPETGEHTVNTDDNTVQMQLTSLPTLTVRGRVKNPKTGLVLGGANVSVTQTINEKYHKTFTAQTDKRGAYELTLYANMPAVMNVSADEYISHTNELTAESLNESFKLGDIALKPIIGVTINTQFTFTPSVEDGNEADVQNWYDDYANVAYSIYNKTAKKNIKQFNVQFPKIVLLEEVAEGNELVITATSKVDAFNSVAGTCKVDADLNATVTLPIIQQGGIKVSFATTENTRVAAMLYDGLGNFVQKYLYTSSTLQINDLADGDYTLISMGESTLFNSIYNLKGYAETGLIEGTDYIKNQIKVKNGSIAAVKNSLIPFFDESKLYYTGNNTSFTVNKNSIVAGNYLTFQAKVDFKEAFRDSVSNMELLFESPEGNNFVENSMMIGNHICVYEKESDIVTVKVEGNYAERVRFCMIPTTQGKFAPNAYVRFTLNGKSITQPIGSVNYHVKNQSINLPSVICKEDINVSGNAPSRSKVEIYDGQQVIGQTETLASGLWRADCKLQQPYNLSSHKIHAKIVTRDGLEMMTETKECVYDVNAIEVAKVTMLNISHRKGNYFEESTVFDFQNPSTSIPAYWYWPDYPEFTFIIDFTNNDPEIISNVKLYVETCNGKQVPLRASYDKRKGQWIASGKFGSWSDYDIPANVSVDFDSKTQPVAQSELIEESLNKYAINQDDFFKDINGLDSLLDLCEAERNKESISIETLTNLESQIFDMLNRTNSKVIQSATDEEVQDLLDRCDLHLADETQVLANQYLQTALSGLNEYLKGMTFSTAEDVDTTQLVDEGYERIIKTDGTELFIYASESEFKFIDKALNIVYTINTAEAAPSLSRKLIASRAASFDERMKAYIDSLNEHFNRLRTYIQTFAGLIEDVSGRLIKANELLGDDLADLDATLKYLRANNGNKMLIGLLEAKFNVLANKVAINDRIITWIENNFPDERWKIGRVGGGLFAAFDLIILQQEMVKDLNSVIDVYYKVPDPCPADQANADNLRKAVMGMGFGAGLYYVSQIVADAVAITSAITGISAAIPSGGASLSGVIVSVGLVGANLIASELYASNFQKNLNKINAQIDALKCTEEPGNGNNIPTPDDNDNGGEHKSNNPNVEGVHDPSGYVYEGIESNRLQGVTATCYYKEIVEDMYGDLHENVVVWNAEDYAQQNPLFTDENGMYRWDVPQGLWQVKFEKEGYQTTYSEWLPVPPPQLEVNVGMVQNINPEVKSARAYEDGVEIEFSKYMKPELLTSENLYLKLINDGSEEFLQDITIEPLNAEEVSEDNSITYTSKVAIKTAYDLGLADEVYVIVDKKVESYAGITMSDTYQQKLDVEKKIRSIAVDSLMNIAYEESRQISIGALPSEASKGKTLVIKSASSLIASVEAEGSTVNEKGETLITLDENGEATFSVNGELLGSTALVYSIVDADIKAESMVNVVDPIKLSAVKEVLASRISGTSLYRGQTVALTCESEGATIYYTTDGSCPCDMATSIKYDGKPIIVNGDVTIKAMAIGLNGSESEIKEYTYTIKQTNTELKLEKGWNWISHNQAESLSSEKLEVPGITRILSQTDEMFNDPALGFVGHLGVVAAHQSLKIDVADPTSISLSGEMYNPSASNIVLKTGWNWLGYPISQTMAVNEALAYLNAEEGDVISTLAGGYAQFSGSEWTGSLQVMTPGEGYLYKSCSDKSFIYNDAIISKAKSFYGHRLDSEKSHWDVDFRQFSDMMCITAKVFMDEEKVISDTYEIGAFSEDGECRGTGKFINDILYLTVYGKGSEKIHLVAIHNETGEMFDIRESLLFNADVMGSIRAPYALHIGNTTDVQEINSNKTIDAIYNLQGQRIQRISHEGVYIINGKKIVINNNNPLKEEK